MTYRYDDRCNTPEISDDRPESDATTAVFPGRQDDLIDGKYRLIQRLGSGGMGEVYKVVHVHLGTKRVIKVMRPHLADNRELQDRFLREAQLATRIQSPNVATLYDFSTLPDGSWYMVWELIEGMDLSTFMRSGGMISPEFAIRLVIRALAGLGAVHAAGIVHRDISPQNLMVHVDRATGEVRVKVIDLGIARSDALDSSLTRTGAFIGKWRYASPEHLGLLEADEKIDGRADLFSMGIVLYELLTGRAPFLADTPGQYVLLHTKEQPGAVALDGVAISNAAALEAVLRKALARNRDDRYETAAEFIAALEGVLDEMEVPDATPTLVITAQTDVTARSTRDGVDSVSTTAATTEGTQIGAMADDQRRGDTIRAAVMAALLTLLVAAAFGFDAFMRSPDDGLPPERATVGAQPESPTPPPGETIEVRPVSESMPASAPEDSTLRPVDRGIRKETVDGEPRGDVSIGAALPPHAVMPEAETAGAETASVAPATGTTDTIPGIGRPLFGRRSTLLTDSAEYRSDFKSGIIRDYSDMWSRGGCDWASIAEGVHLADYAISVSPFRDLTDVENARSGYRLEEFLQEELDGIGGSAGRVSTENAIFLASDGPDAAIGIEMIFRDSSGRVIAKIRHTIHEDSAADAAEEMVEAVTDFIEDHDVVRRGK